MGSKNNLATDNEQLYGAAVKDAIGASKLVKTHMADVHLGEEKTVRGEKEAVKNIRPENYGFVDLTPLSKRKDNAVKSAMIDAAYSPDLHTRAGTYIVVNGKPRIIEGIVDEKFCIGTGVSVKDYVTIMRRFDSKNELKALYEQGLVTKDHAIQMGELFAEAHKNAKTDDEIANAGYNAIKGNWLECFKVTKEKANAIGVTISPEDYDLMTSGILEYLDENDAFLQSRRDSGFIRQCHGDGHSGNMFVEDGKVKIFDGIGFKDEFSYSDVIADLAFAYMDAITYGRNDIAETMKETYLEKTGDNEGMEKLLGFYTSYRAFVRGEVTTMIANGLPEADRKGLFDVAAKYFEISKKYLPVSSERESVL